MGHESRMTVLGTNAEGPGATCTVPTDEVHPWRERKCPVQVVPLLSFSLLIREDSWLVAVSQWSSFLSIESTKTARSLGQSGENQISSLVSNGRLTSSR